MYVHFSFVWAAALPSLPAWNTCRHRDVLTVEGGDPVVAAIAHAQLSTHEVNDWRQHTAQLVRSIAGFVHVLLTKLFMLLCE